MIVMVALGDEIKGNSPPNSLGNNKVIRFDASQEQMLEVPYSQDLEPGEGEFSFATWIYVSDPSKAQMFAGMSDPSGNHDGWNIGISRNTSAVLPLLERTTVGSPG